MTLRTTFACLLGVSLLPGCGHSPQPTIRQVSYRPNDRSIPSVQQTPPEEDFGCPGEKIHPRNHVVDGQVLDPKQSKELRQKLVKAANAKPIREEALGANKPLPGQVLESAAPAAAGAGRTVRLADRSLTAPESWTRESSELALALASYTLKHADGDPADAQLTVTPVPNVDPKELARMRDDLARDVASGSAERLPVAGGEAIVSENAGEAGENGDPAPVSQGRYRVLNATVFVGDKAYSVVCSGPDRTVASRAGEFREFLRSLK